MSVTEYQGQDVTRPQMIKCIKWCQNQLQMQAWTVCLETGDVLPKCLDCDHTSNEAYGASRFDSNTLNAIIWINTNKIKKDNANVYSVIVHEMIHCFMFQWVGEHQEIIPRILEPIMYRTYCHDNKIKQTKAKLYMW